MSHNEPPKDPWEQLAHSYLIWISISALIPLAIIILVYVTVGSPPPTTQTAGGRQENTDSGIESARQSLARQTNIENCRTALQQINVELNEQPKLRPPALAKQQADWLREQ